MTAAGAERAARSTIRDSCGHCLQRLVRLCGLVYITRDNHPRGLVFGLMVLLL